MSKETVTEQSCASFLFGGSDSYLSQSPFILAVVSGDVRKVQAYLQLGYDINERDSSGKTPLIKAVEFRHESMFDFLIDKNADITAVDNKYTSVIEHIIAVKNRRFFYKLIDKKLLDSELGYSQLRKALKYASDKKIEGMRDLIVRTFQRHRAKSGAYRN